jgi:hypothetical protein
VTLGDWLYLAAVVALVPLAVAMMTRELDR